jgi:transcription-repair coupling factor (superfamily II helicase)
MHRSAPQHQAPARVSLFEPVLPDQRRVVSWTRLAGDSLPLALAHAARRPGGPLAVITPDMQSAEVLQEQLEFFLAGSTIGIRTFPDWETLPYDTFSPHQDIISERLATLNQLAEMRQGVLIIAVTTLLQRLPPRSFLYQHSLILRRGQRLDLDAMRIRLDNAGYRCVSQVMEHGEFSVRGSLLDLYPMGSPLPLRIDLFDADIDSIRTFDPETQRSLTEQDAVNLLPAREFPLDEESIRGFRQRFRASFEGNPQDCSIYREISQGITPGGIEYYLPLFFEKTETLFDYLPGDTCLAFLDAAGAAGEDFRRQLGDRFESRRHDRERPLLPPERLYLGTAELRDCQNRYPLIRVIASGVPDLPDDCAQFATRPLGDLTIRPRQEAPGGALQNFIAGFPGRILLTAESSGRRETLIDQLAGFAIRPAVVRTWAEFMAASDPLCLTVAPLEQGLIMDVPAIAVITETSLFGERARQSRRRKPERDPAAIIRDLTDLNLGAPVVHENHGVGRYRGLETLSVNDIPAEYLCIEYGGGDKLYVPVASLQLVSRYTGASPEEAPLHKLGGDQWQRARKKAAQRVHDVAVELLDIYARRAAHQGHAYASPQDEYAAFAAAFPFEETPDQENTIASVLADMQSPLPMDRVVCGDVGFGKTEVAMRAAFLAIQDGRQVAVLVPTTLLAQQHYQNFRDRFSDWPVRIEALSRFRSGKQQEVILAGLAEGSVDLVIGTHKLLQDQVRFRRLGLLIIDEEHRFGVTQKERLKKLRAEIDILTLTATPIPRTLNMSLSGLRDLSIISTPPAHRLAVKTFISEWNDAAIRESCLREIKRGGQIYFLHNQVESIERIAGEIVSGLPTARCASASWNASCWISTTGASTCWYAPPSSRAASTYRRPIPSS